MTAVEDANRALVIEAFETLFNRRDYATRRIVRDGGENPETLAVLGDSAGVDTTFPPWPHGIHLWPVFISAGIPESALAIEELARFFRLHARCDPVEEAAALPRRQSTTGYSRCCGPTARVTTRSPIASSWRL